MIEVLDGAAPNHGTRLVAQYGAHARAYLLYVALPVHHQDQIEGGFEDALAHGAFAPVFGLLRIQQLRELRIELAGFGQQCDQHEGGRQQTVEAAQVETEVEAPGIEQCAQRDVEDPGDQRHHQPEVDGAAPRASPKLNERNEGQQADCRHDDGKRPGIAVAAHHLRQERMARRGEERQARNRRRRPRRGRKAWRCASGCELCPRRSCCP